MAAFNVPYFHFCLSSDSKTKYRFICSYNTYTCDFNHAHSLTNLQWSPFSTTKDSLWAFINWTLYMVRVGATKAKIGPPNANQAISKTYHNSHHVHITLWVTLPISPCPTFSVYTEPMRRDYDSLSVQCTVWLIKSALHGLKGLLRSSSVTSNTDL